MEWLARIVTRRYGMQQSNGHGKNECVSYFVVVVIQVKKWGIVNKNKEFKNLLVVVVAVLHSGPSTLPPPSLSLATES
jgi:hypothetical protein